MRFQCNYFKGFAFFFSFSLSHVRSRYSMRCCCQAEHFVIPYFGSNQLLFVILLFFRVKRLSLYRNTFVNSTCNFLQSLQILEKGLGKISCLTIQRSQNNLKRTENKVNRCKQNEYGNREKKYQKATRDVLFFNMFTLFILFVRVPCSRCPFPALFCGSSWCPLIRPPFIPVPSNGSVFIFVCNLVK